VISWGVLLRLAPVLFVCAACFADMPPNGLGSGTSSDASATTATTDPGSTGSLGTTGGGATSTAGASTSGTTGSVGTGGVSATTDATTASETTGSIGTTGDPDTTVGSTTGPPPWDACKATDKQVACVGCCSDAIKASDVYYAAFADCLCQKFSPCFDACQLNLCVLFGAANQPCLDCAAGPGIGCQQAAIDTCAGDPGCAEFLDCAAASDCSGKP
jgi:hypothetical protein